MNEELRMYCLTMYNLSPIQQGIQSAHAVVELSLLENNKDYIEWAKNWKTMMVMNGGTSTKRGALSKTANYPLVGSMELHREQLKEFGIQFGEFREPDLNYSLSGLAFVVPESIFNLDLTLENKTTTEYKYAEWLSKFRFA